MILAIVNNFDVDPIVYFIGSVSPNRWLILLSESYRSIAAYYCDPSMENGLWMQEIED